LPFLYAAELKKRFNVYGHFYKLKINGTILRCRSILELIDNSIVASNINDKKPDAVVVMMNPGSSHPLDKNYDEREYTPKEIESPLWEKEIVPTQPDNAQYQIMRVMVEQKWKHVRILNLSDLRNSKSNDFRSDFINAELLTAYHPHSMFNPKRKNELLKNIKTQTGGVIIIAWGNIDVLKPLAENALKSFEEFKTVGIPFDGISHAFKYPSPLMQKQKLEWLESIKKELAT